VTASRHAGFTLLELCLALVIGVMIILLAVPSVAGLVAEQRLRRSFERFDRLVAAARVRSVTEQRAYILSWERAGIVAHPTGLAVSESPEERLVFGQDETFRLRRPAALLKNPPAEWIFWRNGTCEPAEISFQGPAGNWLVSYDPLTGRGTFLKSAVP
jgi:Tfp pilus assembly protein FimT